MMTMEAKYIKIFTDEVVTLETSDASILSCIIQSSKKNFAHFENCSPEIQELYEIIVTVNIKGKDRLDLPIKIKDIQSIERMD
ncbi:MAG: hypothetical protein ACX93O_03855 [Flagellimonas sp.]